MSRSVQSRFTVSQLTADELNDACDLLEVLDAYLFRRAAEKLTGAEADKVRSCVEDMTAAAAVGDKAAWAVADNAFHSLVSSIAGNKLVTDLVRGTRRRIQRFWLRATSDEHRLRTCSREHEVLATAMISKDYDAIQPNVTEHITHMRRAHPADAGVRGGRPRRLGRV